MNPKALSIESFDYTLPDELIAAFPTERRDGSRLMTYIKGEIVPDVFVNIGKYIQQNDLLVLNETKVIPARLYFKKATGGIIEIFCLQPHTLDHQQAMQATSEVAWEVMIGGAKKWKDGKVELHLTLQEQELTVSAERLFDGNNEVVVFKWDNARFCFSEILSAAGELPLPPYFDRKAEAQDYERYQTVFARFEGSVAAPTAGLHFTPEILKKLADEGVQLARLILHVGSGTFKPVTADRVGDHAMHGEVFEVALELIEKLRDCKGKIIPVGTTSMRTIESLYWLGVKLLSGQSFGRSIELGQWEPYELPQDYSKEAAMQALLDFAQREGIDKIAGSTSVIIAPGYQLRVSNGIITNFHLPKSTLILLIAAVIGEDWRKVYEVAVKEKFRFLSYGDSSLLIP